MFSDLCATRTSAGTHPLIRVIDDMIHIFLYSFVQGAGKMWCMTFAALVNMNKPFTCEIQTHVLPLNSHNHDNPGVHTLVLLTDLINIDLIRI